MKIFILVFIFLPGASFAQSLNSMSAFASSEDDWEDEDINRLARALSEDDWEDDANEDENMSVISESHEGDRLSLLRRSYDDRDGENIIYQLEERRLLLKEARAFLKKGGSPDVKDKAGWPLLMVSVDERLIEITELLIENGADPNAKNNDGRTALMLSAEEGYEEIARLLIENGADPNAQDNDGWTALMLATEEGYEEIARLLIENGADPNAQNYYSQKTALHYSTKEGYEEIARLLITKGADPNIQTSGGQTALHYASAAYHNMLQTAQLLIESGADLNARDNKGRTPLMFAVSNGRREINDAYLEEYPDFPEEEDWFSSHSWPESAANKDIAQLLIEKKANLYIEDSNGRTALHYSAKYGYLSIYLLIESGAQLNAQDNKGRTALHYSAEEGLIKTTKLLVNSGADPNTKDKRGHTPFDLAVKAPHAQKTAAFLHKKTDTSWRDWLELNNPF